MYVSFFLLEVLSIFLTFNYQTAAEGLVKTHFFPLVPAVPGADSGPFGHVGPEPEQKLFGGAGEPYSGPE